MTTHHWTHFTFVDLQRTARRALRRAEEESSGCYLECLVVNTFSAFALEAYCNHLGYLLADTKWDSGARHMPMNQKIDRLILMTGLDVSSLPGIVARIQEIIDVRDCLAHGRTVTSTISADQYEARESTIPWRQYCTPKEARRIFDDVDRFMRALHAAAGQDPTDFAIVSVSGNMHTDPPGIPPAPIPRPPKTPNRPPGT